MKEVKRIRVSIIIPTYNEAKFLPRLLKSLNHQTFRDFEVIVADADSKDHTAAIAKKMGAHVVKGGLPGAGRNAGAKVAKGDFLYFFDADVDIPNDFIEKVYTEMQDNYYEQATCEFLPMSDVQLDKIIHAFTNSIIRMGLRIDPKTFGFCIFMTRRLFERIGGFDEAVRVAEDSDLVRRAAKIRPLEYIYSTKMWVSVRRYAKEGRLAYAKKGIRMNMIRALRGEIKDDSIEYEFGGYDTKRAFQKKSLLDHLEKLLLKMDVTYRRRHQHILQHKDFKMDEFQQQTQYIMAVRDIRKLLDPVNDAKNFGIAGIVSFIVLIVILLGLFGPLFPWSPLKPQYARIEMDKANIYTMAPKRLQPQYKNINAVMRETETVLGMKYHNKVKVIVCLSDSEMSRFLPWLSKPLAYALPTGDTVYISPKVRKENLNTIAYLHNELASTLLFQNSTLFKNLTIIRQHWIQDGVAVYAGGPVLVRRADFVALFKQKKLVADEREPYLFKGIGHCDTEFNQTLAGNFTQFLIDKHGQAKYIEFVKEYIKAPGKYLILFKKIYDMPLQDAVKKFAAGLQEKGD